MDDPHAALTRRHASKPITAPTTRTVVGRSIPFAAAVCLGLIAPPASSDVGAPASAKDTAAHSIDLAADVPKQDLGSADDCVTIHLPCERYGGGWVQQGPALFRVSSPATAHKIKPEHRDHAAKTTRRETPASTPKPSDDDFSRLLKAPRDPQPIIDVKTLISKFEAHEASLELVREGKAPVPRIFLARLPSDLSDLRSARLRKAAFIKAVLPLILRANQDILAQRRRLLAIQNARQLGIDVGSRSRRFLQDMAEEYETAVDDFPTLLRRVDIVPPSLAIAQAAEESGWGTSRFARRGNAVFGQRTYKAGRGMVPLARDDGERHEVLTFNSLQTSVRAYLWNLNTHFAYQEFRNMRARQRENGGPLDSHRLVGTLLRYSERGNDYIDGIRAIMRVNQLEQFDRARLAETQALAGDEATSTTSVN